jgi:protein-S-isoprenylcysteine O-methyltransferase Ste14
MSTFKLVLGVLFNVITFGGLLFFPAGTLDWWRAWVFLGVVFVGTVASVPIGTLVLRILGEEQFLKQARAGYNAYTERVRYRLIPFLW